MHDVQLLLDMDGVLTNWWMDAFKVHDVVATEAEIWKDKLGHYGWVELMKPFKPDLSVREFWAPMEYDFWANLQPLRDAIEIVMMLEDRYGQKNITLCTSPSENHGCVPGKKAWIKKILAPHYHKSYNQQFGAKKWLNANPRSILIDDHAENCTAFYEHGGHSVLVPRIWNPNHMQRHNVIPTMKVQLDRIDEIIKANHSTIQGVKGVF